MAETRGTKYDVNQSLPWFPDGLPWYRRIICILGYHAYFNCGQFGRRICKYCWSGE